MRPAGGTDGAGASGREAGRAAIIGDEASRSKATGSTATGGTATGAATGGTATGATAAGHARPHGAAATFRSAITELEVGLGRQRGLRPELTFEQEPAPRKLAPYAASVAVTVHDADGDVGWGRFVLLYDPAGQRGWGGPFRIIAHIRVDLEPEIAADPLVGEVGWSWLTEALDARAVGYHLTSGTVTRVVTEGFGAKQDEPATTEFELRASWSPLGQQPDAGAPCAGRTDPGRTDPGVPCAEQVGPDQAGGLALDSHVAAWCDALCAAAGLPPLAAGVSALRRPRGRPSR
jgi:hypothetical protein